MSPLDSDSASTSSKKKRKSSAEKFLEDNSEYYGFQVLPSKLRSSSSLSTVENDPSESLENPLQRIENDPSSFPNPFLDYLHRSNGGDHESEAEIVSKKYGKIPEKILYSQTFRIGYRFG